MKYKVSLTVPPVTGALLPHPLRREAFVPWQPSTWPACPRKVDAQFVRTLSRILNESMLGEIRGTISDIVTVNGSLENRGHVVTVALMCALDTVSLYAYSGTNDQRSRIVEFVENHFPDSYKGFAGDIYDCYRNAMVHSWNLFAARIGPGDEPIRRIDGSIEFGILNFNHALRASVRDYIRKLPQDSRLRTNALRQYFYLKNSARP